MKYGPASVAAMIRQMLNGCYMGVGHPQPGLSDCGNHFSGHLNNGRFISLYSYISMGVGHGWPWTPLSTAMACLAQPFYALQVALS
jgi:hypothetical protein